MNKAGRAQPNPVPWQIGFFHSFPFKHHSQQKKNPHINLRQEVINKIIHNPSTPDVGNFTFCFPPLFFFPFPFYLLLILLLPRPHFKHLLFASSGRHEQKLLILKQWQLGHHACTPLTSVLPTIEPELLPPWQALAQEQGLPWWMCTMRSPWSYLMCQGCSHACMTKMSSLRHSKPLTRTYSASRYISQCSLQHQNTRSIAWLGTTGPSSKVCIMFNCLCRHQEVFRFHSMMVPCFCKVMPLACCVTIGSHSYSGIVFCKPRIHILGSYVCCPSE